MEIISNHMDNFFFECVSNAKFSIKICSPFVKHPTVEKLYKNKNLSTSLELVTNFNINNFYQKAADVSALKMILENNNNVFNYQKLHAKIYIFDKKSSIITSANLSPSGLSKNYEYGVFINKKETIKQICSDYDNMKLNEAFGGY